jgi:selenocysteine-specific elongation factor
LEGAEIVPCSAIEGAGLDELALAVRRIPRVARASSRVAWLPIDRVLSIPGAGTVVTGSLAGGILHVGDEIDLLPSQGGVARCAIRGLHVHGAQRAEAAGPTRVAVSLRLDHRVVPERGAVLATAGSQVPTRAFVARVTVLGDLPRRCEIVSHVGTFHGNATVKVLARKSTEAIVHVESREPLAAHAGQRFVLRRPDLASGRTLAGGEILDPHPRGRRRFVETTCLEERVLVLAEQGAGRTEISRRLPFDVHAGSIVDALVADGRLTEHEGSVLSGERVERAASELFASIGRRQAERPERDGVPVAELRSTSETAAALAQLEKSGRIQRSGAVVRVAGQVGTDSALRGRILDTFARAGLSPPSETELLRALGGPEGRAFRDALDELKRRGSLRPIGGMMFESSAVEALKARVRTHLASKRELRPTELKELCGGLTRKYAIPLLEWLDREGVTKRVGDVRVAGPKA